MRVCPSCDTRNEDDRDFCSGCGQYIRWEPTQVLSAIPEPQKAKAKGGGTDAPTDPAATPPGGQTPPAQGQRPAQRPGQPQRPGQGQARSAGSQRPVPPKPGQRPPQPQQRPRTAPRQPTTPPPPAPLAADAVLLTLRRPEDDSAAPGTPQVSCDAGGQAPLLAQVRNQSGIVDNYDLRVDGLPEGWSQAQPATLYLVPFGSRAGEGYEDQSTILLSPPRLPEAEARAWPITVVARSKAHERDVASAPAMLVIRPYREYQVEINPERQRGRSRRTYQVVARNTSNAPIEIDLTTADPENACRFRCNPEKLVVPPAGEARAEVEVRPRRQIWIGRSADRRFELRAQPADLRPGEQPPVPPRQGTFVQQPWIPWWVMPIIPLIAAAIALFVLTRPNNTTVPDLSGRHTFASIQQTLADHNLKLGKVNQINHDPRHSPGTVTNQVPLAGKHVKKDSTVDIFYTVDNHRVDVPNVLGMSLAAATAALDKRHLVVGPLDAPPADPNATPVVSQTPPHGTAVFQKSPIKLFFQTVATTGTEATDTTATDTTGTDTSGTDTTGTDTTSSTGATGTDATGTDTTASGTGTTSTDTGGQTPTGLKVPDFNGAKLADVLAQAKAAGVQVHQSLAISGTVPKGRVVAQVQKSGVTLPPGSTLEVSVSIGEPRIAFDNGSDIFTADGYSGGEQRPVATTKDDELEPAWSPNGKLIAYRRGPKGGDTSRIYVVQVDKPSTARPLTRDGFDDRRPAFSPNGQVVAFVEAKPGGTGARVLCFKRLSSPTDIPACKGNPGVNVSRPTWTPDGKTIYVQGQKGGTDQKVQIWAYHTSKPNSSKPSDWTVVGAVSAPFEGTTAGGAPPGVNMIRADPAKPEIGFTANWRTGVYRLWVAPIQPDGSLGTPHAVRGGRINACEFSYRLDGQEIVYVEADAACSQGGKIERNDVTQPVQAVALTKVGFANPAWDPRPPGG